jgi:hypothetical protein
LRAFGAAFRAVRGFFRVAVAILLTLGAASTAGWQFPLGLFRSAMMAMVQRFDARGLFFHPQLSVAIF